MRKAIISILLAFLAFQPALALAQTDYRFTGQELDSQSNLYYYGQRYYGPNIGKFIQPDPIILNSPEKYLFDPQQHNPYAYARNNPIRFIDPTGELVSEYQPYQYSGTPILGQKIGEYRGVEIGYTGPQSGKGNHDFQCTKLVKDFTKAQYGVDLSYTGDAIDYADQLRVNDQFEKNNPDALGSFSVYQNSGTIMPQENDIITWSGGQSGHVGIIAEVTFDNETGAGYVYTLEQNVRGTGLHYQTLTRTYNNNGNAVYTVGGRTNLSGYEVAGWTHYNNQSSLPGANGNYTNVNYTPASKETIQRTP
jgi:RHS repeat-associated protein